VHVRGNPTFDQKKSLVAEIVEAQIAALGQRICARENDGETFAEKFLGGYFQRGCWAVGKTYVDFAAEQGFALMAGENVAEVEFDFGEKADVLVDHQAHNVAETFAEAYAHGAEFAVARLAGNVHGQLGLLEDQARRGHELQAGVGEENFSGATLE